MDQMLKRVRDCLGFKKHEIEFDENSFEDRAQRAQKNAHAFSLLADLKIARISYLRTVTKPIPLIDVLAGRKTLPPAEAVARFENYVDQAFSGIENRKEFSLEDRKRLSTRNTSQYWQFLPNEWKIDPDVRKVMRGELSLSMMSVPPRSGLPYQPPTPQQLRGDRRLEFSERLMLSSTASEMLQMLNDYIKDGPANERLFRQQKVRRTTLILKTSRHFYSLKPTDLEEREFKEFERDPAQPISVMQRCRDILNGLWN